MSWSEAFSHRYDEWAANVTADIPFCCRLAEEADGALVELAVGNGRMAFPVAMRTGRSIVGIDTSAQRRGRGGAPESLAPLFGCEAASPGRRPLAHREAMIRNEPALRLAGDGPLSSAAEGPTPSGREGPSSPGGKGPIPGGLLAALG